MNNIIISDPENLEKIKKNMSAAGSENFHVLADFDRTLTTAFTEGQRVATVFAQIRNGNHLSPEYDAEAHRLFGIYHPIEIDQSVGRDEKNTKMHEWWHKHFDLLIRSGLNRDVLEEVIQRREFFFRNGALSMIDKLNQKKIPLVIMSAGLGDVIRDYLRAENKLYDTVHIIANFFEFGVDGRVVGVKEPIVHSVNKHEILVDKFPAFDSIENRKNVLLLGDGVDDVGMIEGFDYENLIKVGFLNENVEENLAKFKENFDVVILGDGSLEYVNDLLKELFG